MLDTIIASIGLVVAVASFIGGFRMIRRTDHAIESAMHKFNGFLTTILFTAVAVVSLIDTHTLLAIVLWSTGLLIHLAKIPLARKGYAVRYGGYMGMLLLATWLTVVFTHLPE